MMMTNKLGGLDKFQNIYYYTRDSENAQTIDYPRGTEAGIALVSDWNTGEGEIVGFDINAIHHICGSLTGTITKESGEWNARMVLGAGYSALFISAIERIV